MGKPNKNQKPRAIKASWFAEQKKQKGEYFLNNMTSIDISKNINRIIRDIAYKNINIYEEWQYFYNSTVIHTIKEYCMKTIDENNAYITALNIAKTNFASCRVYNDLLNVHIKRLRFYQVLLYYINTILATKNLNYMYSMMNELFNIRFDM